MLQRAVRDARSQAKAQAEEEAAVRLEEAVSVALQQAERNRRDATFSGRAPRVSSRGIEARTA